MMKQLEPAVAAAFYSYFADLRECQKLALEPLLAGRNLILSSSTGSGKTEAVLAPLISRNWRSLLSENYPGIIYLSPTKALINDLYLRLENPLSSLHLRLGIRHGDQNDMNQAKLPQVLITTPESLEVMLLKMPEALNHVLALIIDEAHVLYNTQRGFQLALLIGRLQRQLSHALQYALISATIAAHQDLLQFFLPKLSPTTVDSITLSATRQIDARIYNLTQLTDITALIAPLLRRKHLKMLCFTNSRRNCESLCSALQGLSGAGIEVFAHYSTLSTAYRKQVETLFKQADKAICIATNTLELGIDIGDIDCTMLFSPPVKVDSFFQKIGRANRRSSTTNVLCLVPPQDSSLQTALHFTALISMAKQGILPDIAPLKLYGAAVQQILMLLIKHENRWTPLIEISELFINHSHLNRQVRLDVLARLAAMDLIKEQGFKLCWGASERLFRMQDFFMLYGNFPASQSTVALLHAKQVLGEIPRYNILYLQKGKNLNFAGKKWLITKIDHQGVHLTPNSGKHEAVNVAYFSRSPQSDPLITWTIWELLCTGDCPEQLYAPPIDKQIRHLLTTFHFRKEQLPYYHLQDSFHYLTFAGSLINRAIALWIGEEGLVADEYSLASLEEINWKSLPTSTENFAGILPELFSENTEQSMFQHMLPPDLAYQEQEQDWLNNRGIAKVLLRLNTAELLEISAPPNSDQNIYFPFPE